MLCLSGFELYSRWVPLFMADSDTDKKKTIRQKFPNLANYLSKGGGSIWV